MKVERECKIVSKEQVGDAVYMTLEVGDMIRASFRAPGQFVHIRCGEGLLLRRPISVCSCMEDEPDDLLSIVFEVRGEGTRWLAGRELGDSLDVLGLAGNGFDLKPEGRSRDKIILEDFFREDCAKVLCATDDGSLGHHGFVDALVRRELSEDRGYDGVLACGPKPMLRNVAKVAEEFGIPCQVSMEERMGCGVGACLVCACDMADGSRKHVCKDGPVFDSREVDWDA